MTRGEIYFVAIPYNTGREIAKDRPAVIVGVPQSAYEKGIVQVVFCTAAEKPGLPEFIPITGTARPSVAMCRQVYTVDISRLGYCIGHCTPDELAAIDRELAAIDRELAVTFGLTNPAEQTAAAEPVPQPPATDYKALYEDLLDRILNRKGA